MNYSEELCFEKHKTVEAKLESAELRLTIHGGRLDKLEQDGSANRVQIDNLIKSIDKLVGMLKWTIGIAVPTVMSIIGLILTRK